MKIGVNGRFLTKPYTGIGKYTQYLFLTLARQNPEAHFILVTPENVHIENPPNMEIFTVREKFPGTAGMRKTYWEQYQVPSFLKHKKVDLFHFPYPANPWRKLNQPVIVTVHDTIPWVLKTYRSSFTTRLYQDQCLKALKYADHIFTVSQTTKTELQELYKPCPKQKISISYNAPANAFFVPLVVAPPGRGDNFLTSPSGSSKEEQKKLILKKYGINTARPYIFYIGGFDERKNVESLVNTFLNDIAPHYEVDLVLAGGKSAPSAICESFDRLTKLKRGGRVKMLRGKLLLTGFITEEDLPALYQSSLVFINLSKKEGCNLPLLEAAVNQVPLIATDIPVHREIVGDVALFCPPDNQKMLASLVVRLLTDKAFYQIQKQKLKSYRCPFYWPDTAEDVMNIYRKLLRKTKR